MESVTLPEGLETIQAGAFDSDYALKSVVIPGSVTKIDDSSIGAFAGTSVRSAGPIGSGCDIQFGWTKSVPDYAFLNAGRSDITGSGLEKVILPEGVESIGTKAFANTGSGSDLSSLYLPDSLTSIGTDAFLGCKALKTAGGTEDNVRLPVTETFTGGILSAFPYLERVTVPAGTSTVGAESFSGSANLKTVILSEGVETIGEKSFSSCAGLTSVSLPNGLSNIGASAFENCAGLSSITIPAGVTALNSGTFVNCTGLKRIILSKNLKSIAMGTFDGCTALTDVYFDGTEDEWKAITSDHDFSTAERSAEECQNPLCRGPVHSGFRLVCVSSLRWR